MATKSGDNVGCGDGKNETITPVSMEDMTTNIRLNQGRSPLTQQTNTRANFEKLFWKKKRKRPLVLQLESSG